MALDTSVQIRKLPPRHISQLSTILDFSEQWKKLMAVIPNTLKKNIFECCINGENPAKYNTDHMRLIEAATQKFKRSGTEILLDEWGCSGKVRPSVGHLLHLLLEAELYRAADYVSEKILCKTSTKRPSLGPAAKVPVSIDENIEENLNDMKYSSSLIAKLNFSSFNNNLNHDGETSSIPHIVVTPDADELAQNPHFSNDITGTNNVAVSLSNMIVFSEELMPDPTKSGMNACRPAEPCIPIISALLEENSGVQKSTIDVSTSQELNSSASNTVPDLTELNQTTGNIPNLSGLIRSSTAGSLNENQDCSMPDLSELNESVCVKSIGENDGLLPNLSELNQSELSIKKFDSSAVISSDILNMNAKAETKQSVQSEKNNISYNIPDLSGLIWSSSQQSYNSTLADSDSVEIAHINSTYQSKSESSVSTEGYENDNSLPNLNVLISDSSRLTVSTFDSSKSRKCNSPLPNLTLTTHLPHYTYEKLKASTNNFNEGIFDGLNKEGRLLGVGAFGKVFLATEILQEPVAVKKIILGNVEVVDVDDRITKQFINEVEVLSKFKHKNLVSLLGFSCDGCTYCLLYDYIPGGTLKDRLQSKDSKLLWQERLIIALGTANAITYLHTANSSPLIHRDVKTANILLDHTNTPKLGDFGVTTLLDKQNMNTCTVIGTTAYMAPEAMRGEISEKCDTFSFGIVLLELLTSLPPFDENRENHYLITHVEELCEDSISPLLDKSVGSWSINNIDFGEQIFAIANQCLEEKKKRPLMVEVNAKLTEITYLIANTHT